MAEAQKSEFGAEFYKQSPMTKRSEAMRSSMLYRLTVSRETRENARVTVLMSWLVSIGFALMLWGTSLLWRKYRAELKERKYHQTNAGINLERWRQANDEIRDALIKLADANQALTDQRKWEECYLEECKKRLELEHVLEQTTRQLNEHLRKAHKRTVKLPRSGPNPPNDL